MTTRRSITFSFHDSRPEAAPPPRRGSRFSSAQAFLSVYLLLVAFMIVLNTFYTPDVNRVSKVLNSVGAQFRQLPETGRDPDTGLSPMAIEAGLQLSDNLGQIFEAYFPVDEGPVRRDALTYSVDVPLDSLLLPEDPALVRPGKEGFVRRIADVLGNAPGSQRYEMEVLTAPTAPFATYAEKAQPVAIGLSSLAEAVHAAGAPAGAVAAGFAPLPQGVARFFFHITVPGARSPRFDGSELKP
ncbi:MAG: hypothetical protein NXI16_12315 [Alphaproteobacteria bacterium]|nr:hypothetical protein [Alphaproteobacteria bacterium]